jgi:choice-of-anchor C domain-containing protein
VADTLTIQGEHVIRPIQNGSFETPEVGTNLVNYTTTFAGWTVTEGSIDILGNSQAADGDQSVDLNGRVPGRIEQTFDTAEGARYEVRFELSKNHGLNLNSQVARVEVSAGDESEVFTFANNTSPIDQKWAAHTFEFTADGASTTMCFESLTGDFNGPALDNVEVVRVIEDLDMSAGGDVLDLRGLLPGDVVLQGHAFGDGWLDFDYSASTGNAEVRFDADGGGDEYVPILTLVGVELTESDTAHYLL